MALYRVTLIGTISGNTFENVLHITTSDVTPTAAQSLANYMRDNWIANIKKFQGTQAVYFIINVRSLENLAPAPFNLNVNIPGTGGPTQAGDNPFTCAVLRLQTNVAGRTGRGRYHMPGVLLATSANLGILTQTTLNAWQPTLNTMMAAFNVTGNASNYSLVICNRQQPLQSIKAVTNLLFRVNLGTMRSRNYGIGV